jgi:protein-S-isoprenylcysteine O-methyltransferase Ste14
MNGVLQDLFTNRAIRRFLSRTRHLLALALIVPLARYMHPEWLPAAVGISLFGQIIQAWCFGSLVKNRELSIRGPYLMVRNPMYLGRFFLGLGFVCLLGSPVAIGVYTILYYPYMLYRVKGEERRLRQAYSDEYDRYCLDVRRFLPSPRRLADPGVWFFDKTMFLENHGHWNILLTLAAYVAIYTSHRLWWT